MEKLCVYNSPLFLLQHLYLYICVYVCTYIYRIICMYVSVESHNSYR